MIYLFQRQISITIYNTNKVYSKIEVRNKQIIINEASNGTRKMLTNKSIQYKKQKHKDLYPKRTALWWVEFLKCA